MRPFFPVVMGLLLSGPLLGQAPQTFSVQGYLTTGDGEPPPDGIYPMVFRLYGDDMGEEILWMEPNEVEITRGVYSAILGLSEALSSVDFASWLWLGVTIDGEDEMPLRLLTSAPFVIQQTTANATVVCAPSLPNQCGGQCVDLNTDVQNCGSCGTGCDSGATCIDAICVSDGLQN